MLSCIFIISLEDAQGHGLSSQTCLCRRCSAWQKLQPQIRTLQHSWSAPCSEGFRMMTGQCWTPAWHVGPCISA